MPVVCGVSEITGLETKDLDEDRRLLLIRRAKGKKDRIVSLSPAMLVMLREYLSEYKPEKYLFEGQYKETRYGSRSLQAIMEAAKKRRESGKQVVFICFAIVLPRICWTKALM